MIYDKDSLKESLSIEEVFDLVNELGGEPIMQNDYFVAKTICHNHDLTNASHKLYYYNNTHLFHCYTGCGDASFDIYDLILRIHNSNGIENFSLSKAITFVARYFGYTIDGLGTEEEIEINKDWQIINTFNKNKDKKYTPKAELKYYNDQILTYLPQPHIIPWEQEGISYSIICDKNIHYDPVNESIIIPHYDINGKLIGIRERTLIKENEVYGKYRPATLAGKMYNHALSFALYNLNWSKENIKKMQIAIIYEG